MGRRISGVPIWAIMALSQYSTREWIILSRCITTEIFSGGISYRCIASMNSRPLFISVAESTVIFAPIAQLGCFNASSRVTDSRSFWVFP